MDSPAAVLLSSVFQAKRQTLSFLWYTRRFELCADRTLRRYDGEQLRHSANITSTTSVTKVGDAEFTVTFLQPDLRYHMRAASRAERDRWVSALADAITNEPTSTSRPVASLSMLPPSEPPPFPHMPAPAPPPVIDFATEWLDEDGRVCPKSVDYATQCPKGHALAPLVCSGDPQPQQTSDADVICRVCHGLTQRQHARDWLQCSVAACCGGYAVCAACVIELGSARGAAAAAGADDFPMDVRCLHALQRMLLDDACVLSRVFYLTVRAAGGERAVPAVAEYDVCAVDRARDSGTSVPDVHQAKDEPQPLQRGTGADGQRAHAAACGPGHVVHQPHLEQCVCRHAACSTAVLRAAGRLCDRVCLAGLSCDAAACERWAVEAVVVVDEHF